MRPLALLALITSLLAGHARAGDDISRVIQTDPNPVLSRGCLRSWEYGRAEFDAVRRRFDQLPRAFVYMGDGASIWTAAYFVGRINKTPFVVAFHTNEAPDAREVNAATLTTLESLLDQVNAESWEHQKSLHLSCALVVDNLGLALPVHPDAVETADSPVGKAYRMLEALLHPSEPEMSVIPDRRSVR